MICYQLVIHLIIKALMVQCSNYIKLFSDYDRAAEY